MDILIRYIPIRYIPIIIKYIPDAVGAVGAAIGCIFGFTLSAGVFSYFISSAYPVLIGTGIVGAVIGSAWGSVIGNFVGHCLYRYICSSDSSSSS